MGRPIRTRGSRTAATLAIAGLIGLLHPTVAPANTNDAGSGSARKVCNIEWRDGVHQVKRLIRCAARNWHVPGGPHKALAVARCESRYDPSAYNPAGYLGVFQQARPYWPGRADRFGFDGRSAFNGRANVIVSIRMAHAGGWGPWGCA